ncbi:MAG TPA: sulfatase-like hydrolase/transferase, partial [Chloroflexota bacterium]|nr:sulfatase-like hydrolase/transferase [Chloroflexota bacterium]
MPDHPNIIVIMADELRADVLGCYGHRLVRTPNLDILADQSVRFDRAFVTCPMCLPSRVSIATGRYVRSHGAFDNSFRPSPDERSLYDTLRAQGYRTLSYGKSHFGMPATEFGFDQASDFSDGTTPFGIRDPAERRSVPHKRTAGALPLVIYGRHPRPAAQTKAAQVADAVIRNIHELAASREPFAVCASFHEPHTPILPPVPFDTMYDPTLVDLPGSVGAGLSSKPVLQRYYARARRFDELTIEDFRRCRAAYYGLVTFLDQQIGRVLAALSDLQILDRSIVVFMADHGTMLGEHGLVEKWGHFYEPLVRIPLLIRFPDGRLAGYGHPGLVEAIDVLPTVLDYAGISRPEGVQGRSLLAELGGEPEQSRDQVFSEWHAAGLLEEPIVMVRTERWKLALYPSQEAIERRLPNDHPLKYSDLFDAPLVDGELYDLVNDPGEQHNRFGDPSVSELQRDLTARIESWLAGQSAADFREAQAPSAFSWGYFQFEQGAWLKHLADIHRHTGTN